MYSERNKYLTDKMNLTAMPFNFSTWQCFGILWEWCQKQVWWATFRNRMYCGWSTHNTGRPDELCYALIHPDPFADAVYQFLTEQANPIKKG